MMIKHRRYRPHPFGFGYYGGAPPPLRERPRGIRRLTHWGAQKFTNLKNFIGRSIRDGIQIFRSSSTSRPSSKSR